MAQARIQISPETVKQAVAAAAGAVDTTEINDWNDVSQPYLTLRQRGRKVSWLVRAYRQTRAIGAATGIHVDPDYLSLRQAREKAKLVYAELAASEPSRRVAPVSLWTWADLDREYQEMISRPRWINRRMKPPSAGTCDDVRLAFAKPSFTALHGKALTALDRPTLNEARDQIAGHRQREKNIAYFKAAMTWAADKHPDASGLIEGVDRWWERLTAGDPDPEQMHAIEARRAQHRERKAALDVKHIGELLVRHEEYCAGRTAEDKISPGIRWGLWWVCYTANRRLSTVKLRRDDFLGADPLGEPGWGRAMWPADTMKAKTPFWLPLPGAVRDVAIGSMTDWRQLVANEGKGLLETNWVFASTQRIGVDGDQKDVSVYPNSLNRHLLRMREAKALDGLPYFSLHLARSVMTNFLDAKVSPVASSLVLAHTLPDTDDEAAPTTREFYLTSQRMDVKATAMRAWSESLIEAYLKAGGTMPAPRETNRKSKLKSKAPAEWARAAE